MRVEHISRSEIRGDDVVMFPARSLLLLDTSRCIVSRGFEYNRGCQVVELIGAVQYLHARVRYSKRFDLSEDLLAVSTDLIRDEMAFIPSYKYPGPLLTCAVQRSDVVVVRRSRPKSMIWGYGSSGAELVSVMSLRDGTLVTLDRPSGWGLAWSNDKGYAHIHGYTAMILGSMGWLPGTCSKSYRASVWPMSEMPRRQRTRLASLAGEIVHYTNITKVISTP